MAGVRVEIASVKYEPENISLKKVYRTALKAFSNRKDVITLHQLASAFPLSNQLH